MAAPPLRILVCLTYYLPHRTGLTLHAQRLAEALVARGHRVTVVSARSRSDLASEETIAGVQVVRLAAPLRVSRGLVMPRYSAALRRLLRESDVVHVHTPMLEVGLVARLARSARVPLVITHHGDLVLPRGVHNRVIERAMLTLFRRGARDARRLVAYSEDYASHSCWLGRYREKVTPILPPIVIPRPRPELVAELRRRHGLAGRRVIGFAGRFVEEKRPDLLLRALPAVAAEFPDAIAAFAGQEVLGYERFFERHRALVESCGDRYLHLGLIDDPDELAAYYATCDVLALPSATECFGLVQAEAMLCGTPVVASDIPGARVPVTLTGMGLLVPPGDVDALADGLREVLRSPERYRRPPSEIAEAFSLARTVDRYEQVIAAAAAGEAPRGVPPTS